ncbi:LysR family transcriptional regulator [Tepidicaulis sp.]|uniref:LysR family transcriptional regulator n=1 Tax=Tepidicaulis sp. TaxID=1920809 RepID=UPI003B591953
MADWNLFRTFLAVADVRSYSAAGRRLKLSHATVGRHVTELERSLGTKLFVRDADGYSLTPAGERLKAEVDDMASAALRAERAASAADGAPKGIVRISTAATLAGYWLMPHMAAFRDQYPHIELEFVTDTWPASVRRREADIVIRLYGPGQENLVGKKIARCGVAFYASRDYAAQHGLPAKREEWAKHTMIGFAGGAAEQELAHWSDHVTRSAPTALRFSSVADQVHAVRAGLGISVLTTLIGDTYDDLIRIAPDKLFSATDIWMLAHPDLRDTAPVRAVFDFIAASAQTDKEKLLGEWKEQA